MDKSHTVKDYKEVFIYDAMPKTITRVIVDLRPVGFPGTEGMAELNLSVYYADGDKIASHRTTLYQQDHFDSFLERYISSAILEIKHLVKEEHAKLAEEARALGAGRNPDNPPHVGGKT